MRAGGRSSVLAESPGMHCIAWEGSRIAAGAFHLGGWTAVRACQLVRRRTMARSSRFTMARSCSM